MSILQMSVPFARCRSSNIFLNCLLAWAARFRLVLLVRRRRVDRRSPRCRRLFVAVAVVDDAGAGAVVVGDVVGGFGVFGCGFGGCGDAASVVADGCCV